MTYLRGKLEKEKAGKKKVTSRASFRKNLNEEHKTVVTKASVSLKVNNIKNKKLNKRGISYNQVIW